MPWPGIQALKPLHQVELLFRVEWGNATTLKINFINSLHQAS